MSRNFCSEDAYRLMYKCELMNAASKSCPQKVFGEGKQKK